VYAVETSKSDSTTPLEKQVAELKEGLAKLKSRKDKGPRQKGSPAPQSQPAPSAPKEGTYSEVAALESAAVSNNTASTGSAPRYNPRRGRGPGCVAVDSLYTAVYRAYMLESRCDGSDTLGARIRLVLLNFKVHTCVGLQVGLYLGLSSTLISYNLLCPLHFSYQYTQTGRVCCAVWY